MTISNWFSRALVATVAGCIAGTAATAKSGLAADFSINFDDLTAGDIVTNQYEADYGVTFSTPDSPLAGPYASPVSSARYPGATGLALRPENTQPENSSHLFSDITISFDSLLDAFSIDALDVDEAFSVKAYLVDEQANSRTLVETFTSAAHTDFAVVKASLGQGGQRFNEVVIDVTEGEPNTVLGGPEYFDNLEYSTVPEPGAMAGLAVIGLFGAKTLKRKRQQG